MLEHTVFDHFASFIVATGPLARSIFRTVGCTCTTVAILTLRNDSWSIVAHFYFRRSSLILLQKVNCFWLQIQSHVNIYFVRLALDDVDTFYWVSACALVPPFSLERTLVLATLYVPEISWGTSKYYSAYPQLAGNPESCYYWPTATSDATNQWKYFKDKCSFSLLALMSSCASYCVSARLVSFTYLKIKHLHTTYSITNLPPVQFLTHTDYKLYNVLLHTFPMEPFKLLELVGWRTSSDQF